MTLADVGTLAGLYAVIGALHWMVRRPLLEISFAPKEALGRGRSVRWWDFLFYASFGLVVTSSVRIAGVLLVFSYLVVPATVAALLGGPVGRRLLIGWGVGVLVSGAGLLASLGWDLPTGATVVTTFGALLALVALLLGARALIGEIRMRGPAGLAGLGIGAFGLVGLAGALFIAFPRMDHHWLDWVEDAVPAVQVAFLTPREIETHRESRDAIRRGDAERQRLLTMQQEVQWGTRVMPPEQQERLRQFLAGRGEIAAGDRMVLKTLRSRARERQRFWLGLPLLLVGTAGAFVLGRMRSLVHARARSQGGHCRDELVREHEPHPPKPH